MRERLGQAAAVRTWAHGATDVGRERQLNEDHYLVDKELGLYLVCDGMGGHAAGDIASRTAAETVREHVRARGDLLKAVLAGTRSHDEAAAMMREAIQSASARVYRMGIDDPSKKGMGTTCTAMLVIGGKGVMGHVGDSRLYLSRQGRVYQLSEDHTFVQEAVRRGMLTPEQAKDNPHQNLVTRAVGPKPSVLVDSLVFDVLPGDSLLLCSDGLHGYFEDTSELGATLGLESLESVAKGLIDTANQRGGEDNITTVVLRLSSDPPDQVVEAKRASRVTAELDAIGHVVLFSELDMKELVKVANAFDHKDYGVDEVVVHEGDVSETLFVIVSGAAKVTRNGTDIALLRAGQHFGEMALLSRRPRSATVRTLKDCTMLALSRERFYEILSGDAVIAAKFLWRLAQTLSLRLDDLYLLQDKLGAETDTRDTQQYGLFPSPFDGR